MSLTYHMAAFLFFSMLHVSLQIDGDLDGHLPTHDCPSGYEPPTIQRLGEQLGKWKERSWSSIMKTNELDRKKIHKILSEGKLPDTHVEHCMVLEDVCIDQGQIILYNQNPGQRLPEFNVNYHPTGFQTDENPIVMMDFPSRVPGLLHSMMAQRTSFRWATRNEMTEDLINPRFSNCTVPVVFYLAFPNNPGEVFEKLHVLLWAATQRDAWDPRYQMIFSTSGIQLSSFLRLVASVHSKFRATTLSEASARHSPNLTSESSAEGRHVRCFKSLAMCRLPSEWNWMGRLDLNTGIWPSGMNKGFQRPNWEAAHALLDFYKDKKRLKASQVDAKWTSLPKQVNQTSLRAARSSPGYLTGRRLRVVVARRPNSPRRNILNADQVIDWCNSGWKPSVVNTTDPVVGAMCVWYDFENLFVSMSMMEQTDVLIGVHGAALINSLFMPLGSSLIEVKPLQFVGLWPNHYLRRMLTLTDHNSSVFWYSINVVNASNSAPGMDEVLHLGENYMYGRDRHVRLETKALATLMDRIATVDGDGKRYKALASAWEHYINDQLGSPRDWVDEELYKDSTFGARSTRWHAAREEMNITRIHL